MLDSLGDAWRLETTSRASLSESSRIETANQHLETATRHSLSSDRDCECARTDTLWRVRRMLDSWCRSKARDSEIEASGHASLSGGHASLSRDHARVSSDRAIETARDSSMTAGRVTLSRSRATFSPCGDSFAADLHHVRSSSDALSPNLASQ